MNRSILAGTMAGWIVCCLTLLEVPSEWILVGLSRGSPATEGATAFPMVKPYEAKPRALPGSPRAQVSLAGELNEANFTLSPVRSFRQLMAGLAPELGRAETGNAEDTPTVAGAARQDVSDSIPPTTSATLRPAPNPPGWNNRNVTVTLSATDNEGGTGVSRITYGGWGSETIPRRDETGTPTWFVISAEGKTMVTYYATDNAGNVEAVKTLTVMLDMTPPRITNSRKPSPNIHGWNNATVTISFACSDALSGLAAGSGPSDTVVSTEGAGQSVTHTCKDIAGNSASFTVRDINIDKTPPAIIGSRTPQPNSHGWNDTDVVVSFACTDALSGVESCTPPATIVMEGANQSATARAVDKADNSSSTVVSGINIHKSAPRGTFTSRTEEPPRPIGVHAHTATRGEGQPVPSLDPNKETFPRPAPARSNAQPRFAVQVGAYEDPAGAQGLGLRLSSRYHLVILQSPVLVAGRTLHRVRILVETKAEAKALAEQLWRDEKLKTWIIPLRSTW